MLASLLSPQVMLQATCGWSGAWGSRSYPADSTSCMDGGSSCMAKARSGSEKAPGPGGR